MPPIDELTRIEPSTSTARAKGDLHDRPVAGGFGDPDPPAVPWPTRSAPTTTDVLTWRDEALMLNLAGFGPDEHQLMIQAGSKGSATSSISTSTRSASASARAAGELGVEPPTDLTSSGWWEQAKTLEDE